MQQPEIDGMAARRRGVWRAWGLLVAGVIATTLAVYATKAAVDAESKRVFDVNCNEIRDKILDRLAAHARILLNGAAFVEHAGGVSRHDWQRFFSGRKQEKLQLPGIQGIGFALLIPREKLAQHIQEIRAEGFPDYRVLPEGERELYSAIIYLEPFTGRNLRAFGYDMLSEPIRRAAMERARDQDAAALSGKVVLVQETSTDVQAGTLMYVPVYRSESLGETVAERRAALLGWVYSPYRMTDLMHGILGERDLATEQRIRLEIFDGGQAVSEALLYDSQATGRPLAGNSPLTALSQLVSAGRSWTLRFTQTGTGSLAGNRDYSKVWIVFFAGLSTSLLLSGFVFNLLNTRDTAQQLALQLTAKVRESEARYRSLLQVGSDGIHVLDLHGNVVEANDAFCHMLGYSREELMRLNVASWDSQWSAADLPTKVRQFIASPAVFETRHRTKDGRLREVEINARGVTLDNSPCLYASARDITERKHAEEVIRTLSGRLLSVVESTRDVIAMMDHEYRYTLFNAAFHDEFKKIFGVDMKSGDSMPSALAHLPDDLAKAMALWNRALAGEDFTVTQQFGDITRERKWYELHFSPVRNSDGTIAGAIHIVRDISDRMRVEEMLQQRDRDLQERNDELIRFTYTVSHDLKSPLVTISAFLSYLEKDLQKPDPAAAAKDLGYIRNAAEKMAKLLDELLMLSRVGRVRASRVDVSLQTVVQEALALVAGRIAQRGVTVEVTAAPLVLHGDRARLVEVFQNLLDNACKFMGAQPTPRIEIGVEEMAGERVILVRDNGIGIDPRHQTKLFGLFEKLDADSAGTGLGLALVKRIVEVHGGRIWVESAGLGKGTTFRFTLTQPQRRLTS